MQSLHIQFLNYQNGQVYTQYNCERRHQSLNYLTLMEYCYNISRTSLAGAPIRIVNALNKYSQFNARLINFIPARTKNGEYMYEEDLTWEQDKNLAIDLIKNADIIHFHHWFDLKFNPFLIDFTKECRSNCKFLRHFHSDRYFLDKTEIYSREWIEKFYRDDILIKEFIRIYKELLKTGKIQIRTNSDKNTIAKEFLNNRLYDIYWEIRKENQEKIYSIK